MNEQNLIPGGYRLSQEEASRGGKNSVESRRRRKAIRQAILDAIYAASPETDGTVLEDMIAGLIRAAESGSTAAWEKLMEYAGLSPERKRRDEELRLKRLEAGLDREEQARAADPSLPVLEQILREVRDENSTAE